MVVGLGAVGTRAARQLLACDHVERLTVLARRPKRVAAAALALGPRVELREGGPGDLADDASLVVFAMPSGLKAGLAAAIAVGAHAAASTDDPEEVRDALEMDAEARRAGITAVLGAAMAPGLSGLLASFCARRLDRVSEVHVASLGTGGPLCARRHHAALSSLATDFDEGAWRRRPGGSGRELLWFPEPVGGADCYRAGLADPALLVPAFPGVQRVTARLHGTRRDRMTAWLPMLRPPHPEGTVGAVRAEVRGWRGASAATVVMGAVAPPGLAAGTVAAVVALWACAGDLARPGVGGVAEMVPDPGRFLRHLAERGIQVSEFDGGVI
ncbi:MAG: hypothetical protein ACR2KC_05915 [Acidimicrobiales bacterium]